MTDVSIKVSANMLRLQFIQCGPDCLAAGCKGRCCDAPQLPTGMRVSIHESEVAQIEARGGVVIDGFLQPKPGTKGCPFKKDHLCGLHFTPDKPFGCRVSPFKLNAARTLIVRHRYIVLPCYRLKGPKKPAYITFRSSLELIFGGEVTHIITKHLDNGGGDLYAPMSTTSFEMLCGRDPIKGPAPDTLDFGGAA